MGFFFSTSICEQMTPENVANLDPRDMVGRFYVGVH